MKLIFNEKSYNKMNTVSKMNNWEEHTIIYRFYSHIWSRTLETTNEILPIYM